MSFEQCMATGRSAEQRFAGHLTSPVFATADQDMEEHWDVAENGIKYDVKAMKKWKREDPEPTDRMHYVELRNVNGEMGWLYGKAHFIVFETRTYWIVVPRNRLAKVVEGLTSHGKRTETPKPYYLYQRQGRQDLMTVVPTVDLLAISNQTIKKYKENERKAT